MAVRVADNLKPANDSTAFPVAYGADIWLDKNKGSGTEDFASIQALYNAGALGGSDIEVISMPDASASYLDKVLLYVGDTGTYEYGKFYKCVSDGETPPSYSWTDAGIGSDPVDGTTIVKDSSTGELSAVQATQSTKGIVKGGNGTQIGSNGEVNVVDRLEEINALPTATADNLDKCYLLKGTQTGYQTGAIYQCQLVVGSDPAEYEWVLLSANPLTFDNDDFSVTNDNVELQPSRRTYKGTRAAWNLLSVAEKTQYGATAFTDDEGGTSISSPVLLTAKSVPGLTLTWRNDHEDAHQAFRVGDVVYVNLFLDVTGTYTGTSGNVELFDMPEALLENGESFIAPYYINNGWDTVNNKPYQLRYLNQTYFENGYSYNLNFQGQIILLITRS